MRIFFYRSSCTRGDLYGAMTSSQPLRLHVDRGLRDIGTHGSPPNRVLEVPVKRTQPVRSPTDLQVGPETLSATSMTLEELRRPYPDPRGPAWLVAQDSPPGRDSMPPVGPQITRFAL
jgi:hypothetical protein